MFGLAVFEIIILQLIDFFFFTYNELFFTTLMFIVYPLFFFVWNLFEISLSKECETIFCLG